jgi:hypothetical protein
VIQPVAKLKNVLRQETDMDFASQDAIKILNVPMKKNVKQQETDMENVND